MIGSPAAIETAKALVHNIMNNTQGNAPLLQRAPHQPSGQFGGGYGAQEAQAKGEVIVPRLSAGMIIGKGGEMIKRLAAETGTKIQFKPDSELPDSLKIENSIVIFSQPKLGGSYRSDNGNA